MQKDTITVVAIAQGFDNLVVRNIGDIFEMPADSFEPRQKVDANGKAIAGQFHEPPSWFEPVDERERKKVEKQRDAIAQPLLSINPANQAAAHDIANQTIADAEAAAVQAAKDARAKK